MKRISITLIALTLWAFFQFTSQSAYSQTTGYSGTGSNIDVNYHRLEWTLNATTRSVSGTVTTYFTTKQNNVSQITFDLTKASYNNASLSVKYHGSTVGVVVSFPTTGNVNILRITLPVTLPINILDSVSITYAGTPPAFSTYGEGMDQQNITGLGNALYTLAESYGDDDFWPCKADMQDKIDSVDFIITTPSSQMAAANGVLVSNTISGSNRIVSYKHRHPIASYLIAVAVAQYSIYNRPPVTINGTSVPIVYYIGSGRTPSAANFTTMDYCRDQLVAFSSVYGDYPFKDEKYGMYEFGWGGGMEHQTFSAMNWSSMTDASIIAHELAHQWFGDKVTFSTWNHLWLAEGFARYSEALAAELVPAMGQNASSILSGFKTKANNTTNRGYSCYLPDASIANSNLIWNSAYGTTVYERGAMVVSMLRKLLGDAKFFQACRNYLSDPALAYRSATTDDLRNHMQAVAGGYDLTPFFNSYVYGNGYPSYNTSIRWGNPGGNRISFKITTQTKSTGSTVSYYHTPIAIRVQGALASQDTVLVIYDQNGKLSRGGNGISSPTTGSYIYFLLNFNPVTVTFDPFNQTLATGAALTFDNTDPSLTFTTLDVKVIDFTLMQQSFKNNLDLALSDSEGEVASVILQKGATSGNFEDAGVMEMINEKDGINHFHFTDNHTFLNETYYRAKITEKSGIIKYSKVLSARSVNIQSNNVYPNPASKSVTIKWNNSSNDNAEICFYNLAGKNVMQKSVSGNSINLSLSHLPAGAYMVIVKQGEKILLNSQLIISR